VIGAGGTAANGTTFNPGDNIDGGSGTDTLNISVSGDNNSASTQTNSAVTLTSIENLYINNFASNSNGGAPTYNTTIDLANATGLSTVGFNSSSASGDTELTNLKNLVGAQMKNGSADLKVGFISSVTSGASDALTLTLGNQTAGTFTANGIETFNVVSGTAANTTTLAGAQLKTVNVSGSSNLTLGTLPSTVTKVDASSFTGGLKATLGNTTTTLTGGAGDDTITFSGTSSVATAGTIDGGSGTDTLSHVVTGTIGTNAVTDNNVISSATVGARYTGFEVYGLSSTAVTADINATEDTVTGGQDMDYLTGVTTLAVSGATSADPNTTTANDDVQFDFNFTNVASTANALNISGISNSFSTDSNDDDVEVNVSASRKTNGSADSMVVTLGTTGTSAAGAGSTTVTDNSGGNKNDAFLNLTLSNEESISILSQGGANYVATLDAANLTSLTLTGDQALTIDAIANATGLSKIDASAMTAAFVMNNSTVTTANSSTTASTITGGSGNDRLTGGTKADSITGNDGADTLFGGDGNDTISGGSGADSISGGSGTDVLTGGDGNDTFYVGTTASDFATAETVDGGSGTDTLSFADVATSLAAADVLGLKSIEKITYAATSNTTALTLTDAVFTANGNTTLTIDASAATSGAVTLAASGLTAANSLYIDVSNTSNTGTNSVVLGAGNDTVKIDDTALDTSGATYTAGSGTDTLLVQTGGTVPGSAISLVSGITGFETISFGTAIDDYSLIADSATVASGATLTVDGSTLTTGKLYYDASSETNGKYSINGGNAADTLIGGQGNDTIAGGSGADSISGHAGVDNLSGGAGDDVFYVTTANHFTSLSAAETVSGGAGNDTLQFADLASLVVGATDLSAINSIETIKFLGTTNTSSLTLTDAVFTADGNTTLTVDAAAATSGAVTVSASGLSAANSLVVDMSATNHSAASNISLGAGNDTLKVDAVALDGNGGNLTLGGGSGTDTLTITANTGAGSITMDDGITGFEKINFGSATGTYTLTADAATVASGATLTVDGSTLTSGTLAYNASNETDGLYILNGGGGADSLVGGQKNDTLSGGSGADILQGGSGTDSLTGGAGADTFVFGTAAESGGANVDSITDFVSGTDKLQFTLNYSSQSAGLTVDATLLSAGTGVAGLSAAQTALSGNRGQMVYDTTNSVLYVNNTNDNLITSLDYTVAINPASTAGNTVAAADINTSITGGSGADSIVGGAGADTIDAGAGTDTITGGGGADKITVTAGDRLDINAADITEGSAPVSGSTNLTTAGDIDIITASSLTTSDTLVFDLADVGNTITNATPTITTSLIAGTTANQLAVVSGTYTSGVFTATGSSPTHTLIQYDTDADTTTGHVGNILIVGVPASASVSSEILTLTF